MQAYTRLWLDRDTKSYFTEEVPEIHKSIGSQWISKPWADTACSSVATRHATQRNSKPQFYNCLPYDRYNDRYIWRYNTNTKLYNAIHQYQQRNSNPRFYNYLPANTMNSNEYKYVVIWIQKQIHKCVFKWLLQMYVFNAASSPSMGTEKCNICKCK